MLPQQPRSAEEPPPFLGQARSPSALWKMAPAGTARRGGCGRGRASSRWGPTPPLHFVAFLPGSDLLLTQPLGGEAVASPRHHGRALRHGEGRRIAPPRPCPPLRIFPPRSFSSPPPPFPG